MGDGTKGNPYTRDDVLRLIEENGGTADGLDLSGKWFEQGIDLSGLVLCGIIMNRAELVGAKFDGSNLSRARLRRDNLQRAKFNQYRGEAFTNLMNADLSGADLYDAELIGAWLNNTKFKDANLTRANVTYREEGIPRIPDLHFTDFRGANLFASDFTGRSFLFTKLEGAYLKMAKIYDAHLEDADWGNYKIGEEGRKEGLDFTESIYRFREMTAGRKALKWWPKPWNRAFSKLLSMLSGYGEKWERVVLSAIVIIFSLAVLYFFGGAFSPSTFAGCLYYSVVSFTALGYGSWVYPEPESWAKGLGAAEAALGVFMMALFLVTFTRKMTR